MISTGRKRVKAFPPDPPKGAKKTTLSRVPLTRSVAIPRNFVSTGKGFPKKLMFTHTYSETVLNSTGAAGALATYNWKLNGMWDTNTTGGGHQPMYFDQVSALYNHYVVVGTKATVRISPYVANNVPALIGCFVNDNTTNNGISSITEQNTVKYVQTPFNDNLTHTFVLKWSAKKYFGRNVIDDPELQGTPSSDPTEISYITVFSDSSQSAATSQWQVGITIEFIVIWKELIDIASS